MADIHADRIDFSDDAALIELGELMQLADTEVLMVQPIRRGSAVVIANVTAESFEAVMERAFSRFGPDCIFLDRFTGELRVTR